MKLSYKFNTLLGTVYSKGNLLFSPDGNTLYSPVGNKITAYDLKKNETYTFPVETHTNIANAALSPNGRILILAAEDGNVYICSLISRTVLNSQHFKNKIHRIAFSPDGKYVAMARGKRVFVFLAPGGETRHVNPFSIYRSRFYFQDDVNCFDWSTDSRVLLAGGKDMSTKLAAVEWMANLRSHNFGGHIDEVVDCFFEDNSLNFYTVSRNGAVNVWTCSLALSELKVKTKVVGDEDEAERKELEEGNDGEDESMAQFTRLNRHMARKLLKIEEGQFVTLTSAAFHKKNKILVTGFSNGAFFLHEMPEFSIIHQLSIGEDLNLAVSSVCFNASGDWIGLASSTYGQLVVWEWQSENYIMKQQGHMNNMRCLCFSPDGQNLVTGGDDGKVKVWTINNGFCFVTFREHKSTVTGVAYIENGKVIVSSSFDGTVRCFDLKRYRNFLTFTSPHPTQFSCLAVDSSGEIICAGGRDVFEIFVWSKQTGRLLEILSGHEAPVSSLSFSKNDSILLSGSWDKTIRLWSIYTEKGNRETINMISDVTAVTFRSDGEELCVATLNGQLTFFHAKTSTQTGTIEGRTDLGSGKRGTDLVTAKQVLKGKSFTSLCYSADGEFVLAAGLSKFVCIYHVKQQILLRKFEITQNYSLDAMDDYVSRRKMTEFGHRDLIEMREPNSDAGKIPLPGVKAKDMTSRSFNFEVKVSAVNFSPTGRCWAATTTEGLLLYSLDHSLIFEPVELETDITIENTREVLRKKDNLKALMMALKLNESDLLVEVIESINPQHIELVINGLPIRFVGRLVGFLADQIASSRHLEFYLKWAQQVLYQHGQHLKNKLGEKAFPLLNHLQRSITQKHSALQPICDHNTYMIKFWSTQADLRKSKKEITEDVAMEL
ncbi:U3 snoRNP protein [Chamberlinius hualienensis]